MKSLAKNQYAIPTIEKIDFDNEISLALESAPPFGPSEMALGESVFDNIVTEPFITEIGNY